jgi:hypothetical protein
VRGNELTNKLLSVINLTTHPVADSSPSNNPIKYMIHTDPYFRQRIEEYQQMVVRNEKIHDPNEPRLVYDLD